MADSGNGRPTNGAGLQDKTLLFEPNVRLYGPINDDSVKDVIAQLREVRKTDAPVVMELTTEGGDAEGGRRIALEIRLCRQWHKRQTFFVGKTVVMSAGVTIMAAFPRDFRYLTADAVLLVHERRMQKTLEINGPMRADIQIVRELLAQLETAQRIEMDGFAEFAEGSKLSAQELFERHGDLLYDRPGGARSRLHRRRDLSRRSRPPRRCARWARRSARPKIRRDDGLFSREQGGRRGELGMFGRCSGSRSFGGKPKPAEGLPAALQLEHCRSSPVASGGGGTP